MIAVCRTLSENGLRWTIAGQPFDSVTNHSDIG